MTRKAVGEAAVGSPGTDATAFQDAPAPHLGHRERLRERALKGGLEAWPDYELLELYLFRSIPRGDVKPLAKRLLTRFGTIGAVLSSPVAVLRTIEGVGEAVALDVKIAHEAARRIGREEVKRRPVVSSWTALLDYVRVHIQHEPREQFRVLFLDKKNQLIADELMHEGTVDHAPVYPREVMRRAVELSSSAVILVHNHPSGDPEPSAADVAVTHDVVRAGRVMGVVVHDYWWSGATVWSVSRRGGCCSRRPSPLARNLREDARSGANPPVRDDGDGQAKR